MASRSPSVWKSLRGPRTGEIAGIVLWAAAVLLAVALLSYDAKDPSWWVERAGRPGNWIGPAGANVAGAALQVLGFSAFVLPLGLALFGWSLIAAARAPATRPNRSATRRPDPAWARGIGLVALLAAFATLLAVLWPGDISFRGDGLAPGGAVGTLIERALTRNLGRLGAGVAALAGVAMGLVSSTRFSVYTLGALAARPTRDLMQTVRVRWARLIEARRKKKSRHAVERKHRREQKRRGREQARERRQAAAEPAEQTAPAVPLTRPSRRAISFPQEGGNDRPGGGDNGPEPARAAGSNGTPADRARAAPVEPRVAPRRPEPVQAALPLTPPVELPQDFRLPPIDFLDPPPAESPVDERHLIERARLMRDKLREFAVEGEVEHIHPGPVVTTYEFKPEPGVKYSRILSLIDDLCLALKAESIRVDRIPGKSTVGVEVPNVKKETIRLRDILSSDLFTSSRSRLTLGLGKTIDGEPYVADLGRMPHLLIAGSTGSGKSVGLNCMITSILYKASPAEVRFILIDPKMLELGVYEDIPHLLIPVVTDMKKAAVALKWAVREMENRYRTLATTGVRNIDQFNALLRHEPGRTRRNDKTGVEEVLKTLPYIVVVIDELADLMMVASVEVEEAITRLAQMARAVGIHLVLATQRPSVDVITGIIKANFPARIAFRVTQKVDSRTILDTGGAEALLGHGDMLFLPPGSSRLIRVHGALVTEVEIYRIVEFLKKQAKPAYDSGVLREPEEQGEEGEIGGGARDEMYAQALRLVVTTGQASISHLQRRLRLGYARAARIVDMMEDEGVIGPGDGAKPRDVLVGPEFLDRLDQMAEEDA